MIFQYLKIKKHVINAIHKMIELDDKISAFINHLHFILFLSNQMIKK